MHSSEHKGPVRQGLRKDYAVHVSLPLWSFRTTSVFPRSSRSCIAELNCEIARLQECNMSTWQYAKRMQRWVSLLRPLISQRSSQIVVWVHVCAFQTHGDIQTRQNLESSCLSLPARRAPTESEAVWILVWRSPSHTDVRWVSLSFAQVLIDLIPIHMNESSPGFSYPAICAYLQRTK